MMTEGKGVRRVWMFFILFSCLAVRPGHTGQAIDLKFRHNAGDRATYSHRLTSTMQLKEEGDPTVAKADLTLEQTCLVQYLGDTASGDWGILGTIPQGKITLNLDGEVITTELEEMRVQYITKPNGELKSVRLLRGSPTVMEDFGFFPVSAPHDIFMLGGVAILPGKPVKVGDIWKGTAQVFSIYDGTIDETPYESVYLGEAVVRGIRCHKIKTTTMVDLTESLEDPSFGSIRVNVKGTGTDTWYYDAERGVIVVSDGKANLSIMVTIAVGGDRTSLTMTGAYDARRTLTEFNGMKIGAS